MAELPLVKRPRHHAGGSNRLRADGSHRTSARPPHLRNVDPADRISKNEMEEPQMNMIRAFSLWAMIGIILLAVAISFIFIVSELYSERVLGKVSGAIDAGGNLTTYGYIIQLISLLIGAVLGRILFAATGL